MIMKISIIIPYYNADKWIGRMLNSLLRQNLKQEEYEIIVVDDGSKDEPRILKEYVSRYDNIRYARQENSGPGTARNTGISMARGEYVFFCDSDDFIADHVLGRLYDVAKKNDLDLLFHNVISVTGSESVIEPVLDFDHLAIYDKGQDYLAIHVGRIRTGVWQYIIKRDYILQLNLAFPSGWIMNEDSSFFVDALLSAGKTGKVEADIYYYVSNSQSILHSLGKKKQSDKFVDNMMKFVKKLTHIINQDTENKISKECMDNLIKLRNAKGAFALFVASRFLPLSKVDSLFSELRLLDAYPFLIMGRHKTRLRLMNIRYLWLFFCFIVNILPLKIRYRLL